MTFGRMIVAIESVRKPVDSKAIGICVVLCFIWGLQQVAIKGAAEDVSPIMQVAIRSFVSGVLLFLWNKFYLHEKWSPLASWQAGLAVGLTFAGEFFFVAEGLRYTSASHISVLLYTAPLFSAVGLALRIPEERLSLVQWIGLLLAFSGIALAFGLPALLGDTETSTNELWWLGDLYGLLAGLSWGCTTVILRTSSMNHAVPTQMLFWQLGAAFCTLFPIAILTGQDTFHSSLVGWSSLIFQAVIVSFVSYLIWCGMLRRYLVARLGVIIFLTPLFGVLLSILLLGETVGVPFVIGSLCVLLGLITVQSSTAIERFFKRLR